MTNDLEKIELCLRSQGLRLPHIRRAVSSLPHFERHITYLFGSSKTFDGRCHFSGVMLELALKLAHNQRCVLLVAHFENSPDSDEHGPRNRDHGCGHGEREQQKQLLAQAHGASSSEAAAKAGMPPASN